MMRARFLPLLLALFLAGCPSSRETAPPPSPAPGKPTPKPPGPELLITFASLDLGRYDKRIERGDLEKLAEILRRDTVDLLALQGVARYPGLAARVDIPEELAAITLQGRAQSSARIYPGPELASFRAVRAGRVVDAPAGLERDYYVHINLERRKALAPLPHTVRLATSLKIAKESAHAMPML